MVRRRLPFRRISTALFWAGVGWLAPSGAGAGVNSWTQVGPEGGSLCTLVAAPSEPEWLYASGRDWGDGRGFFRSTDNGESWQPGASALQNPCVMTVDSVDPLRLYGRFGVWLYRSTDGGDSWALIVAGLPGLPDQAEVVVAATDPSFLLIAAGSNIFRSRTRGDFWETIWSGEEPMVGQVNKVATDPVVAGRVFALSTTSGPFRSDDYGETWTPSGVGIPGVGNSYFDIVFDPVASERLYLSTSLGIHRSTDGGASWQLVLPHSPYGNNGLPLRLGPNGALFVLEMTQAGQRVLRSRDGGAHWQTLPFLLSTTPYLALTSFLGTAQALFVTTHSGVLRSIDEGDSWQAVNHGLFGTSVRALSVDRADPGSLWGLGIDGVVGWGALRSRDRGRTWEFFRVNPATLDTRPLDITVDPNDPSRVRVVGDFRISTGWVAGLSTTEDGGETWLVSPGPDSCLRLTDLEIDTLNSSHLYLVGEGTSIFCPTNCFTYSSPDGGATWQCIQPEDPGEWLNRIAPHPGGSGLLLALGRSGIYRSVDSGVEWVLVEPNPLVPGPQGPHPALFMDVEWVNDDTAYATNFGAGLYVSLDRGSTWGPAAGPPESLNYPWISDLAINSFHPERVFATAPLGAGGVNRTVVWSRDAGLTWELLSTGLLGWPLSSLTVDPVTPNRLYVSAEGGGVLAYDIQEPEPCAPSETAFCISDGRFRIESIWRDFAGRSGVGHAQTLAADTGTFWFFSPENLELFVKEIDGTDYNNAFWTFYGSLSNVEFTVLATDSQTGAQHGYFNPGARFASKGDIESFPQGEGLDVQETGARPAIFRTPSRAALQRSSTACVPNLTTLCLQGGRFAASVTWRDFVGHTGVGTAIPLTPDTGSFWFFDSGIHELAVKVIDGQDFNNAFWVFYGSLSNVEFELTVVDTETGETWSRSNPSGTFASGGDIEAFPQLP